MKDIIKKVLKEDLDWAKNIDPIQDYISWLNDQPFAWQRDFENVPDVIIYPRMDAETMVTLGRVIEDESQSTKRRLEALTEYEDYSHMGTILENTKLYFNLIVHYSDQRGVSEETVVELANEIIRQGLHRK